MKGRRAALALVPTVALLVGTELALAAAAHWVDTRDPPPAAEGEGAHASETLLCVGDSVTWGFPGPREESYPSRLAAWLPRAHVRNLGRPGSAAQRALEGLNAEPLSTGPETILWLAGFNNCTSLMGPSASATPLRFQRAAELLDRARTWRMLTQVTARLRPPAAPPAPDDPRFGACSRAVAQGVRAAFGEARRRRARLVALTYPEPTKPTGGRAESLWITPTVNAAIRSAAGPALADTAHCVQAQDTVPFVPFFTADEVHLTREGHAALAQCAARAVERAGGAGPGG